MTEHFTRITVAMRDSVLVRLYKGTSSLHARVLEGHHRGQPWVRRRRQGALEVNVPAMLAAHGLVP